MGFVLATGCQWMYYDSALGFPNLYTPNVNWVDGMLTNFFNIKAAGGNAAANPPFMTSYIASPAGNPGYAAMLSVSPVANTAGGFSIFNNLTASLLGGGQRPGPYHRGFQHESVVDISRHGRCRL